MTSTSEVRRPSEARDRLLRTASAIFYAKGINSVGVEEIVSEAHVTRATFYRHFPSKDDLIVAYLKARDERCRAQVHAITEHQQPAADTIRAIARWIVGQIKSPEFRGCGFLNAAAEYPDADSRVQQAVLDHRAWFQQVMQAELERLRGEPSEAGAQFFVMIRDGAMAAGCLAANRDAVCDAFMRGVEAMLTYRPVVDPTDEESPTPAKDGGRTLRGQPATNTESADQGTMPSSSRQHPRRARQA
ncbi:MAG TPA: TetR/AcrR family transcriptional regulator [Streptosporangiaceae bacterium]